MILLLVFGAKRLPEMGRSLGAGLRGFKESVSGVAPADQITGAAPAEQITGFTPPVHVAAPRDSAIATPAPTHLAPTQTSTAVAPAPRSDTAIQAEWASQR